MDYKRNIFIILSVIALTLPFPIIFFFPPDGLGLSAYILVPLLFYCCYVLIQLFGTLISAPFRDYDMPDIDEYCSFLLGIFLFGQKRIYYSDLGYFYMSGNSTLSIWKQDIFFSKRLFKVHYGGDIEYIRTQIKSELEKIYQREIFENQRRKALEDWNGYIDKKSERDDKLNKILN